MRRRNNWLMLVVVVVLVGGAAPETTWAIPNGGCCQYALYCEYDYPAPYGCEGTFHYKEACLPGPGAMNSKCTADTNVCEMDIDNPNPYLVCTKGDIPVASNVGYAILIALIGGLGGFLILRRRLHFKPTA